MLDFRIYGNERTTEAVFTYVAVVFVGAAWTVAAGVIAECRLPY